MTLEGPVMCGDGNCFRIQLFFCYIAENVYICMFETEDSEWCIFL